MSDELSAQILEKLERQEKINEGVTLGLGAIAESLEKMNTHYDLLRKEKEEEEEEKEKEDEEEVGKLYKAELVKDTAVAVLEILKEAGLIDLGGDEEKVVEGTKWPMSKNPPGEDQEDAAKLRAKPEEQQKPLAAGTVAAGFKKAEGNNEVPPKEDEEKEDEEKEDEKEKEFPMVEENKMLKSELETLKKSFDTRVQAALKEQLEKMGFREETSLRKPMLKNILGDAGIPIVKAESKETSEDLVEQLSKLSYAQLGELKAKIALGHTEGIPEPLRKMLS